MSEKLSNEDNKYLISLIKEEKIVEAVKFVREKTDMSLLEAKKYVDLKRINENAEYSQSDYKLLPFFIKVKICLYWKLKIILIT